MIKKVYSKVKPKILLNVIYNNEITKGKLISANRIGISDEDYFIQSMHYKLPAGNEIKPHKHNPQNRKTNQTHESFLVFKGSVELSIYDIDGKLVEKAILNEGDCSTILNGGHSLKILKHASIYEFKNGPYNGPEKDKTNI